MIRRLRTLPDVFFFLLIHRQGLLNRPYTGQHLDRLSFRATTMVIPPFFSSCHLGTSRNWTCFSMFRRSILLSTRNLDREVRKSISSTRERYTVLFLLPKRRAVRSFGSAENGRKHATIDGFYCCFFCFLFWNFGNPESSGFGNFENPDFRTNPEVVRPMMTSQRLCAPRATLALSRRHFLSDFLEIENLSKLS